MLSRSPGPAPARLWLRSRPDPPTWPARASPRHRLDSCRDLLWSGRTHASRQLLFLRGLACEQGILFLEFLVKIFHLIKFLQPALLCVCQKVGARAALSSAPWEAGSQASGATRAQAQGRVPRSPVFSRSHEVWDCQRLELHYRPHWGPWCHQYDCLSPLRWKYLSPGTTLHLSCKHKQFNANILWTIVATS